MRKIYKGSIDCPVCRGAGCYSCNNRGWVHDRDYDDEESLGDLKFHEKRDRDALQDMQDEQEY